ncbi:hypothetical protein [Flagellimonas allohymeniacidonis]|uniref:hypothetical protein n=1 Tax=Flagellimonas allohymeniacidonis TaxID=2517819 RepID=UPI0013EED20F|nr:hypothetical protein [Allomuricauda hymeniacidonis]
MRLFTVTVLAFSLVMSCEEEELFDGIYQEWTLVKMTGQMPMDEKTGDDMDWQEEYVLMADGTFVKTRLQDGGRSQSNGEYDVVIGDNFRYMQFTHESDHKIIGNCFPNPVELLLFTSDRKLIGTWESCDGPGLEYMLEE